MKGRGRSRIARNTDLRIADALSLASAAQTDRVAAVVLCGLSGALISVSPAVLTAMQYDQLTIVDFSAIEARGTRKICFDIVIFLGLLKNCRELAARAGVSLPNLGQPLGQWSADNGTPVVPDEEG